LAGVHFQKASQDGEVDVQMGKQLLDAFFAF